MLTEKKALWQLVRIYVPLFVGFYLTFMLIGWAVQDPKPALKQDVILSADQISVVYSPAYNVGFFGLD